MDEELEMLEDGPQDIEESPEIVLQHQNLAEDLDEEELTEIGAQCLRGFELDLDSRSDWEDALDGWIALAKQIREEKSYPWANASNVKYPLLTTAAMQFSARAYPSLIPSNGKIVKVKVIGKDPTGEKFERGQRVGDYMSYQILYDMESWEEDMDRLLMQLPVVGTMFKKTWYDKATDKICSRVILPKNLVVNNWAHSLHCVERISEVIEMSPRLLKERQNQGIFIDPELGDPITPENSNTPQDETTPYTIVEQHTFLDLDEDDYAEPYIVTFERHSGKVLRITRRYRLEDVEEEDGKVKKIKPLQMYTKFGFVPNPDGSFYDIGFGVLLGPINESVNTLINILIDSGHLATLQAGFIGKAIKLKMGDEKFSPGEWKPVNAVGDDLRKQIVPLPVKEPSNVLFELMGTLVTSGKELASVAEIFTGKMPGQNTPATTTMATVEQGMKVFTAVYKRIYRALEEEFKKIYELNSIYLDPYMYSTVIDAEIGPDDFDSESYDVCPGADPTAVSQTEKLLKAQGLLELLPLVPGMLDPVQVISRVLEAQEQPNWQQLFPPEIQATQQWQPPPDPKLMAIQEKVKADQQKAAMDIQQKQMEMELDARDKGMQMQMKQQEHAQKMQHLVESTRVKAASDIQMANIYAATERQKGQQTLQNNEMAHQQKMQQTKEQQSLQKQTSGNGAAKKSPAKSSSGSKSGSKTSKKT